MRGHGGLGHPTHQRNREHDPPDRHAQERRPRGLARIGEAEPRRPLNPQQVQRQQQAAAQVADGKACRRHGVELVAPGDVRQQRVVERQRSCGAHVAEHEEHQGEAPVARGHEDQAGRRQRAEEHEGDQQALLVPRGVGQCAERRRDHGGHGERDRGRDPEPEGGHVLGKSGGRDLGVVDGEDRGDDGGPVGGVRPVVHDPGPQLRTAEADAHENGSRSPAICHRALLRPCLVSLEP